WGAVVGQVVTVLMLRAVGAPYVLARPGLREWRRVVRFGTYASSATLIAELGNQAPDLILGRMLGFGAVAYLSRANGLIKILRTGVQRGIMPVALPAFSRHLHQGHDLRPYYCQAVLFLTAIAWPFFAVLAVLAEPLIQFLYGHQWD